MLDAHNTRNDCRVPHIAQSVDRPAYKGSVIFINENENGKK